MKFSVCSLNVRGLNSDISKENLATDLYKYKGDVLCLQETKIANGADINIQDQRLLCFQSDSRHYGNGFLLNKYWSEKVHRTWKVNDRICVLQLDFSETFKNEDKIKLISIINVYGLTSQKVEKDPDELDSFYKSLNETINCVGKNTILILAGDFNAKIGQKQKRDTCIGSFSKEKKKQQWREIVRVM